MAKIAVMIILLFVSAAFAAESSRPRAADILPQSSTLPGSYRSPWEIGGENRKYRSEAEWRQENLPPTEGVRQLIRMIPEIPEDDWEQLRKRARAISSDPSQLTALAPSQRVFMTALVKQGSRQAVIDALSHAYRDIVDSSVMAYVRVENPGALASRENDGKDPGAVSKLTIVVQIWTDAGIQQRKNEVDLSPQGLNTLVSASRTVYERMVHQSVTEACRRLEEELIDKYHYEAPREEIAEILAKMSAYSALQLDVKGHQPPAGDASYALIISRSRLPEMPQIVQGHAQVRRGAAVFNLTYEVAGKYADNFYDHLKQIFAMLTSRAAAYELTE